jgi:hypothetical protein
MTFPTVTKVNVTKVIVMKPTRNNPVNEQLNERTTD